MAEMYRAEIGVLREIAKGAFTRAAIAERLGLTKVTVGRAARRLIGEGLVKERKERSGRGKPIGRLSLTDERYHRILQLDGKHGVAWALGLGGEVSERLSFPCDCSFDVWDHVDVLLGQVQAMTSLRGGKERVATTTLVLSENIPLPPWVEERFDLVLFGKMPDSDALCLRLNRLLLRLIFDQEKSRKDIDKSLT